MVVLPLSGPDGAHGRATRTARGNMPGPRQRADVGRSSGEQAVPDPRAKPGSRQEPTRDENMMMMRA